MVRSDNTIKCLPKWFSCYGLPKQLVSDNGPQFISEKFKYFMKENGINHLRTAAYHQSSNGQAERYVQTVKNGLRSNSTTTSHTDIDSRLDSFLMAYRSTTHTTTGDTPSLRFLGRNINTKLDLMKPDRKSDLVIRKAAQNKYRNAKTRLLLPGDKIVFRSYSGKQKWVQGTVVKRINVNDKIITRHIDHIKNSFTARMSPYSIWDDAIHLNAENENARSNNSTDDQSNTNDHQTLKEYPRRVRNPIRYGFVDQNN